MQFGKILRAEAFAQADRNGQCIAQRQHGRGARGRRQIQPAGLALHAAIESHVAGLRQRRIQIARKAHQRVAFSFQGRQQAQNLFRLAAHRERHNDVAGHQHAQVTVHRLGRMQKQRRAPGRAERRRDLLRDDAALAHAGDYHAAVSLTAVQDQFDGARKGFSHRPFQARGQCFQRRGLGSDQGRRLQRSRFTIVRFRLAHRLLMLTV